MYGAELERLPSELKKVFSVCIGLNNRECKQNVITVEAEIMALIYEKSFKDGVVIYTDRSVLGPMERVGHCLL